MTVQSDGVKSSPQLPGTVGWKHTHIHLTKKGLQYALTFLGHCYKLNVYISLHIYVTILAPKGVYGRRAVGSNWITRVESLWMGSMSLWKYTRAFPSPFSTIWNYKEAASHKLHWCLSCPQILDLLAVGFWAPLIPEVGQAIACHRSHPDYGNLLGQSKAAKSLNLGFSHTWNSSLIWLELVWGSSLLML